eukprot:scaffold278459_cov46-Prasinocladus_malaysianus.AAC.2
MLLRSQPEGRTVSNALRLVARGSGFSMPVFVHSVPAKTDGIQHKGIADGDGPIGACRKSNLQSAQLPARAGLDRLTKRQQPATSPERKTPLTSD